MADWSGQDKDIETAAMANNSVMCKRRRSYMFCAFTSSADRVAFKSAISGISGISYQDWPYPHDTDLFIVKSVPV